MIDCKKEAPTATREIEQLAMESFEDLYPEIVFFTEPEEYKELNFEDN